MGRSKGSFNLDTHPPAALLAFLKTGLSSFFSFSLIQLLCVPIYRRCTDSGPGPGCRVQDVFFEALKQNWKTGSNKGRKVLQTLANICLLWCDRVITTKHGGGREAAREKGSQAEVQCSKVLGQPVMSWGCMEPGAMLFQGA